MATSYGILGQVADASTEAILYTAPALKNVKIKVTVNNRAATSATFKVSISPDGGATATEDYIAFDHLLVANESITSITYTINALDVVRCESSTSTVTFIAFGLEQDTT